jgi:hypothetical protein
VPVAAPGPSSLHSNVEAGIVAVNANDGDALFVGPVGPLVIVVSGVGAGVGLAVAVGVGVAVGDGVGEAVGDGVGVATGSTMTVPVISTVCALQTNVYVPGASNLQLPCQPTGNELSGIGGVVFVSTNVGKASGPRVFGQNVGDGEPGNATLCTLVPAPVGKSKVTLCPTVIVTLLSFSFDDDASWNQLRVLGEDRSCALMRGPAGGVGVAVGLAVGVGVALDVGVAVGVDPPVTMIVPSIPPWAWQ